MAIVTIETPNEFNYAKQTIPFLVRSTLIGIPGGIDPIETSFRFVFDLIVQLGDGTYKTYASVGIPARPDNFYGFLDVAPMILDAITFDLATHKQTFASPCPNSIVKFRVFCTERYLDTNGNFITGARQSLGEYYAIDGAGNEGITPYLIDSVTNKKPLHHHFLIDPKEFAVSQKEPLTLSWLSRNDLGVNELEYIHGNYGSFSNIGTVGAGVTGNVMTAYTGITKNALTTLAAGATTTPPSLRATMNGIFGTVNNLMTIKFTNIDLSPNTTYKFTIGAKVLTGPYPGGSPTSSASNAITIRASLNGTNVVGVASVGVTIQQAATGAPNTWYAAAVTFATNGAFVSGDLQSIDVIYVSPNITAFPLGLMNGVNVNFTGASLYEINNTGIPFVKDVQVVTDNGTIYTMPSGYTANILPLNDTPQSRFDTPVGPYKQYHPTGQDATTGFWLNSPGVPANWFQVRLRNSSNTVIGLSEKIYQTPYNCDIYDKFRLKWKNSLGGWDYYTFTKVSKAKTNIERENFKRSRGLISATAYQELSTDRGYQSLNIKLQDTYTVISDWVGDGTAKWMLDLFTSDEVYLLNPEPFQRYVTTNEYDLEYPVFVQQTDVEYMNNSGEAKLKNFVIDITPAIRWEENTTN